MNTKYGIVSLLSDDVSTDSNIQMDNMGGVNSSVTPSPFYPIGLRMSSSSNGISTVFLPLIYTALISFIIIVLSYQCRDSIVDKSDKVMLSFFYMSTLLLSIVIIYMTYGTSSINPWYFLVVVSMWTLCTIYDSSELLRVQIEKTDASVEIMKNKIEEDNVSEVVEIKGKKESDSMSTKLSELSKDPIRDHTSYMFDTAGYNISDFVYNMGEVTR